MPNCIYTSKVDLGTSFLTANMSSRLDTKTVMSLAYAEILTQTLTVKETSHRDGRALSFLSSYGAGAPKRGHREEGTGGSPAGPNARSRKPLNASRSPAPPSVDCGTEC